MILRMDDWVFDVEMARTMEYSAAEAADNCDCAYCRNFYKIVDQECPQLRPMLAQFGLQLEAPDELMPYDIQDFLWYEGKYLVFGKILEHGKDRIRIGDAYIWPMDESGIDAEGPNFALSLEELCLSWVLDEPLKDVLSPANEPSFLKKMWNKLLEKFPKNNPYS